MKYIKESYKDNIIVQTIKSKVKIGMGRGTQKNPQDK